MDVDSNAVGSGGGIDLAPILAMPALVIEQDLPAMESSPSRKRLRGLEDTALKSNKNSGLRDGILIY